VLDAKSSSRPLLATVKVAKAQYNQMKL